MNPKVFKEVVRSYTYVLTWMSISISVILFNKWLLAFSGFPYPLALTLWHMTFCSTVGFLCVRVFKVVKSHNMSASDYVKRVMPIGGFSTLVQTVCTMHVCLLVHRLQQRRVFKHCQNQVCPT